MPYEAVFGAGINNVLFGGALGALAAANRLGCLVAVVAGTAEALILKQHAFVPLILGVTSFLLTEKVVHEGTSSGGMG